MKKKILLTMLVCTLLNACSTYSPLVDTMGRSGTFDESRAEHFSNDKVICEQIATNNTTFFGNIGFWIMSPQAETEHDHIYKKCLTNLGQSLLNN